MPRDDIIARTKAILKAFQTGPEAAPEFELIVTIPGLAEEEAGRGEVSAASTATSTFYVPAGAVAGDGSAACPEDYPVKGNASSGIYHVPRGGSYDRTIPEFCFGSAADAAAAGFRAAKR